MTQRGDVVIKTVISNYKCRACEIMFFLCKCIPERGASQKLYLHIIVHIDSYCQAASIFVHLSFSLGLDTDHINNQKGQKPKIK